MYTSVINASFPVLSIAAAVPMLGALLLWLVPATRRQAKLLGMVFSLVDLGLAGHLLANYDYSATDKLQFAQSASWIPMFGVSWSLALSPISLAMVVLALALVPLVLIAARSDVSQEQLGGFTGHVLALESFIVVIFSAQDLFVFYLAFEAMLIPVYFLIGNYGGPQRRRAAMKFLLYSLAGGLVMLVAVAIVGVHAYGNPEGFTFTQMAATYKELGQSERTIMFICLLVPFIIKAPMVPLHTWLPDTAEQATPGTSVLLIGVLDKIGTYGMIVMCVPLLTSDMHWVSLTMMSLAIVAIIYGGLAAIVQDHLYRLISYTSVSHFGFMVLGIFGGSIAGASGAMVYMVAHGLSIAGLYLISGFLVRRTGTARLSEMGGIARVSPVIAGTFLFSALASIALPGLSGFVPEWLVLTGTFSVSTAAGLFALLGVVIAALYALWPYQKVFTGAPKEKYVGIGDLNKSEKLLISPLLIAMLALGLFTAPLTNLLAEQAELISAYTGQPEQVSVVLSQGGEAK